MKKFNQMAEKCMSKVNGGLLTELMAPALFNVFTNAAFGTTVGAKK